MCQRCVAGRGGFEPANPVTHAADFAFLSEAHQYLPIG